jgi:GlcNAc-P-P-Und epimerase
VELFNYVDEPKLSTKALVDLICEEMGTKYRPISVPLPVVLGPAKILDVIGNILHIDFPITAARIRKFCTATNFDSTAIRQRGFRPRLSSIEALRRTVSWHVDRNL